MGYLSMKLSIKSWAQLCKMPLLPGIHGVPSRNCNFLSTSSYLMERHSFQGVNLRGLQYWVSFLPYDLITNLPSLNWNHFTLILELSAAFSPRVYLDESWHHYNPCLSCPTLMGNRLDFYKATLSYEQGRRNPRLLTYWEYVHSIFV